MTQPSPEPRETNKAHIVTPQTLTLYLYNPDTTNTVQRKIGDGNDSDSVDSMHKFDSILRPKGSSLQNEKLPTTIVSVNSPVDRNNAEIYYEHLQGGLVLIYV